MTPDTFIALTLLFSFMAALLTGPCLYWLWDRLIRKAWCRRRGVEWKPREI